MGKLEGIHPAATTLEQVQRARDRTINGAFPAFACVAPLMPGPSLLRAAQHGWRPIHAAHMVIALLNLVGALGRGRLPYRAELAFFLGAPSFGLPGGGHIILVLFAALTPIDHGVRAGLPAARVILCPGRTEEQDVRAMKAEGLKAADSKPLSSVRLSQAARSVLNRECVA